MDKNKILIAVFSCLLIVALGLLSFCVWKNYAKIEQAKHRRAAWLALEEKINKRAKDFGQEAGIAIKDFTYGWQININENKLFPSASMVKLPIMASCILASSDGKLDLRKNLALKNKCRALGSGRLKEYAPGTEFGIEDLIEIMITESDNTAANMIIDYIGFDTFNDYFKKMGLNHTNIVRKMMDFKDRKNGRENYTTAKDLSGLLEKIYKNKLINKDYSQKCMAILKKQKIKDRIPRRLPAGIVVANKTGLEKGICHDAGIVFTPKGDFLICVLTKHNYKLSKPAKRFISRIASDVYNYYQSP